MAGRGQAFHEQGFAPGYPGVTPAIDREDEIKMLKAQIESLERSRKAIEKRLGELGKE
jgi:hypothetical protein